jgi:hypothetical protein
MLGVSTSVVRNHEHVWGLDAARVDLNRRVIRYHQDIVVRALVARGLLECPAGGLPPEPIENRISRLERFLGIKHRSTMGQAEL